MHLSGPLIRAAGASDCEEFGSGLLLQPVNALTSLSYTVIGAALVVWANRTVGAERVNRHIVAWLMVATGIGSFAFHGSDGGLWQFLHDITFLVTVWAIAVINLADYRRWRSPVGWGVIGIGAALFSVALAIGPTITNVLTGFVTVVLIVSDTLVQRSGSIHRPLWFGSLLAMTAAVVFFLLGRTGGPLCDPESLFQGHGLWHLLSGVAIALYFVATSNARVRRGAAP